MDLAVLLTTYYRDTLPNKRRSRDSVYFELHQECNLRKLCCDINNRTFQPTAYAFIVSFPVTREVFAGDMQMRIAQHYVEKRVRPIMEKRLIDTTFNNRVGMGSLAAVNNLANDIFELSNGYTEDCWVIKVDMKGYFPNANQDIAYKQLEQLILDDYKGDDIDDLLYLLRASIYSYPTDHCTRKTPISEWVNVVDEKSLFKKPYGIGGAIGHLIWQMAMTFYINDVCVWLVRVCLLHITVYMDDIAIVTRNKEMVLAMIPELRAKLALIGVTLHPKKFYCQHYTKGVEFIGHHIMPGRIHVNNRCYRNAIKKVNYFNKKVNENNIESFTASVNSYLGRFKGCADHNRMMKLLDLINEKWWNYVEYNESKRCIHAKKGYTRKELIVKRFNLHDYDRKRKTRKRNGRCESGNLTLEEFSLIQGLPNYS